MKPASDGKQKGINCIILALLMFIGLGFCSSNKSLYLSAITDALGIKRSVFSLATSLRFIVTSVSSLFFGNLVSRFGTKKLMLTGILCLYAAELFGNESYDKILGLFVSFNVAGYAFGTPLVNLVFDISGSYVPAFFVMGFAMLAVLFAMQFVINAAHKKRRESTQ